MHLQEIEESGYRIFIGALESPLGDGYTAALVVQAAGTPAAAEALYRDDRLACGYRWAAADDAMSYALRKARSIIRGSAPAANG